MRKFPVAHGAVFTCVLCVAFPFRSEALELPEGSTSNGKAMLSIPGDLVATAPGYLNLEVPVKPGTSRFIVRGKRGVGGFNIVGLKDAAGKQTELWLNVMGARVGDKEYPDCRLLVGRLGSVYVRPDAGFYSAAEALKRLPEWLARPGASEATYTLEFRKAEPARVEVWANAQYLTSIDFPGDPVAVRWVAKDATSSLSSVQCEALPAPGELGLPVERYARPGGPGTATVQIEKPVGKALQEAAGQGRKGIAIAGLGKFTGLGTNDLTSLFWSRRATSNLDEQRMFSVPRAIYDRARVLCVSSPEPGKVNQFTLRVTRYAPSIGNAVADTLVQVPAANAPDTETARRVGWVSTGDGAGARRLPLWLVEVPIRNGDIADVLQREWRASAGTGLDVELLEPLDDAPQFQKFPPDLDRAKRMWRPNDKSATSSVTVYGVSLVRGAAQLQVKASTGHQVFYAADKPAFEATVAAEVAGTYQVGWEIADIDGKITGRGEKSVTVPAGDTAPVSVPVPADLGWFAVRCVLRQQGRELWDYRTSYVMLPPDTRKAGYESPFHGAWFGSNHGSNVKLDEVGPLLQRAGIRRADLSSDMPETLSGKYGFTNGTIPFAYVGPARAMNGYRDGTLTLDEALAQHESFIREHLELWPHADRMLVFHESGARGAPFPSEMWGEVPQRATGGIDPNSPEALLRAQGGNLGPASESVRAEYEKNWPKRMEYLTAMAKMVRQKFPKLKMQYGNDGNSLGIIGELFRRKFPREYMDTIAIEDLGQTMSPERWKLGSLHSAWFLRELARKTGYGDVPVTACTEWIGRMTEKLGNREQAEWKARDGLLGLAYGFDTISIAGINDAGDGYYYSLWGNGGLCERYPVMAPKPSYAAVATLTRVLDKAKFKRPVPTGSPVVYCQEFQKDGSWVYTLWTPRDKRNVTLEFAGPGQRTLEDTYGRARRVNGVRVPLTAGTGVQYLISPGPLKAIFVGEKAISGEAAPKAPATLIPLEQATQLVAVDNPHPERNSARDPYWWMPLRKQGNFTVTEVMDPEMGKCLEIALVPEGTIRDMEVEYRYFKLPQPIPVVAGNAAIWVKGNGGWGQLELTTGDGPTPWGAMWSLDYFWRGESAVNFEGWRLIRQPFENKAWTPESKTKITGLYVEIPRKVLVGTELEPVKELKVRVKSAMVY